MDEMTRLGDISPLDLGPIGPPSRQSPRRPKNRYTPESGMANFCTDHRTARLPRLTSGLIGVETASERRNRSQRYERQLRRVPIRENPCQVVSPYLRFNETRLLFCNSSFPGFRFVDWLDGVFIGNPLITSLGIIS